MKVFIVISAILLLLSGCSHYVTPALMVEATKKCETNGGLSYASVNAHFNGAQLVEVVCKNGASFFENKVFSTGG